jgi:hypothetical protein
MEKPDRTLVARVLALDISTNCTGAVVMDLFDDATLQFRQLFAIDQEAERATVRRINGWRKGDAEYERFCRIRAAAVEARAAIHAEFDHIAYEVPNQRGAAATAAIWQAIGAVLDRLQPTVPVPLLPIHASTAKAVVGTAGVRAAGETAKTLDEKMRCVEWMTDTLLCQSDGDGMVRRFLAWPMKEREAIADAAAVAVATVPVLLPGMQACSDRRKSLPKPKKKAR